MYGICYTNLEYTPVATRVELMAVMPDNLRLVTRSTISDTKGDSTTTTLLVTILLPCTETVADVRKIPGVLLYPTKLRDISCMCKQCVPGYSFVAWL